MNVMLLGAKGQLGSELISTLPKGIKLFTYDVKALDISNKEQARTVIMEQKPEVIINAAAYTAVDKAESEREKAYQVNVTGAKNLAELAKENNARLIHISTDFVFDGLATSPYKEDSPTNPVSYYGETKSLAEKAIKQAIPNQHVILRTAWLYSSYGNNFVKTMLKLMQDKDELNVVSDQQGTPTYAKNLAQVIWQCCQQKELTGTYHWSDEGKITWYEFAIAIQEEALKRNLLSKKTSINPIPTAQYPTPATRPGYSVLDKSKISEALGIKPNPWRENLGQMLDILKEK